MFCIILFQKNTVTSSCRLHADVISGTFWMHRSFHQYPEEKKMLHLNRLLAAHRIRPCQSRTNNKCAFFISNMNDILKRHILHIVSLLSRLHLRTWHECHCVTERLNIFRHCPNIHRIKSAFNI